ncbi:heme exporter protein CcmB [Ectothiorhodospira mobilis]|uniref:Heme exporter protein CcmB n=1 Tax=Ectothiorhodospira mobilis TaxID=195064 RepID=A0A1I4PF71_ECTMO|nr:heme exporter protein CcmB [Ectothiorhodospira mobilis]
MVPGVLWVSALLATLLSLERLFSEDGRDGTLEQLLLSTRPLALLFIAGLYTGLIHAPPDYRQGESHRILFIHVPAAWMSMFLYVLMAGYLVWQSIQSV